MFYIKERGVGNGNKNIIKKRSSEIIIRKKYIFVLGNKEML